LDLELHTRRLQDVGLNAYESRAYLVLIGHSHFKALEVAGRANIPRQKIYEVLDSLVEKGFVRVVQGKAKQFSAVEPQLALDGYLSRKRESFTREWEDRQRLAKSVSDDLAGVFENGNLGKGPLDYLRIVADTRQIIEEYRRMLVQTKSEYLEFARPPYGVDPGHEPMVRSLADNGTICKIMFDSEVVESEEQVHGLELLQQAGAEVRLGKNVPMKLALFDSRSGMISLDDPVISHPQITALVFDHESLASAMRSLFDDFWNRSSPL
jgi:hypothetical protein